MKAKNSADGDHSRRDFLSILVALLTASPFAGCSSTIKQGPIDPETSRRMEARYQEVMGEFKTLYESGLSECESIPRDNGAYALHAEHWNDAYKREWKGRCQGYVFNKGCDPSQPKPRPFKPSMRVRFLGPGLERTDLKYELCIELNGEPFYEECFSVPTYIGLEKTIGGERTCGLFDLKILDTSRGGRRYGIVSFKSNDKSQKDTFFAIDPYLLNFNLSLPESTRAGLFGISDQDKGILYQYGTFQMLVDDVIRSTIESTRNAK